MADPIASTLSAGRLETTSAGGAPDWSTLSHDVLCPLCEYNLRGLTEARCPECGYRFEWPEVLDPVRRPHSYLFEHHPERNVGSFLRTAINGLRPRAFWSSLHPGQPSDRRRLIIYWLLCGVVYLAMTAFVALALAIWGQRPLFAAVPPPSLMSALADVWMSWVVYSLIWGVIPAVWPWCTLLALMIFRWSMRRAKIRDIHVLRCCLYSFDGLWWWGLCLLVVVSLHIMAAVRPDKEVIASGLCFPIGFGIYKLRQAYTYYLRFDHPGMTVLVAQIIVILGLLCVWAMFNPDGPAYVLAPLFSGR